MGKAFQILEFDKIINKLKEYSYTDIAKERFEELTPYLSETEVIARMNETTEARKILDSAGNPTLVSMKDIQRILEIADKGGMLSAEELEYIAVTLRAIKKLKSFLERCKSLDVGIAYFSDELDDLDDIRSEIERCIRDGKIDDYASTVLREIRRNLLVLEEKAKAKAESLLVSNKKYCSENFIAYKNGHICLPVKKDYKSRVEGSVIEKSGSEETLFIEPASISKLNEEITALKIDENNEEIRILYTLTANLSDVYQVFIKDKKLVEDLDFIFAKAKLSAELEGVEPKVNTKRYMKITKGRHPLIEKEKCVPLDFEIGSGVNGIIITGPNTGGKTVCIKTVGLLSLMTQCGLHIPCEDANICMNNKVLCDIGDGQDLAQNLSTFSAHIANILDILAGISSESLVLLDELGSGTDPTEGMGIAIAILEELIKKNCLFVATTHYPEVKEYAEKADKIINARMEFDRKTLRPLYKLEMGKAGESQALYIAKKLGMPKEMIIRAYRESYKTGEIDKELIEDTLEYAKNNLQQKIQKKAEYKETSKRAESFNIGDSVLIYPEKKIGIVCKKANEKGEIMIQKRKEKILVNHKKLQLKVPASQLYPEDYDFSIVFDSVENRKKRHQMGRKHCPGVVIEVEE